MLSLPTFDRLNDAHRTWLTIALGLQSGSPPDPALVTGAVLSLLRLAAAHRPLLLIVDDLHWLDRSSAVGLVDVGRQLRGSRVGLLAAFRIDADSSFDAGGMSRYEILPLAEDAAAALVGTGFPLLPARARQRVLLEARP